MALSLGLPPPDVIRRRVPLEPGLSSILDKNRGRPADWPGWIRRASGAGQGGGRDEAEGLAMQVSHTKGRPSSKLSQPASKSSKIFGAHTEFPLGFSKYFNGNPWQIFFLSIIYGNRDAIYIFPGPGSLVGMQQRMGQFCHSGKPNYNS